MLLLLKQYYDLLQEIFNLVAFEGGCCRHESDFSKPQTRYPSQGFQITAATSSICVIVAS